MKYPSTISKLIDCFQKLPGVGEKTAERYALSLIELDDEILNQFSSSVSSVKEKIVKCKRCFNLAEEELCEICKNSLRDSSIICVVEEVKSLISFEKAGTYHGTYHVLNGLISPLDGINPEDINLESLIERIKKGGITEVIIAFRPCIEGETTSLYISKRLQEYDVKISKIAYGIPLGADMGYVDPLTLEISLENRQEIS